MSVKEFVDFIVSNVEIKTDKDYYHGNKRSVKSKCWLNIVKPDDVDHSLVDMMMQRYVRPSRKLTNAIKTAIIATYNSSLSPVDITDRKLERLKEGDVKLKWNQYAGCSCPCSPGYTVSFNERLYIRLEARYCADIYVTLVPLFVEAKDE